jgi:hypothetical protein
LKRVPKWSLEKKKNTSENQTAWQASEAVEAAQHMGSHPTPAIRRQQPSGLCSRKLSERGDHGRCRKWGQWMSAEMDTWQSLYLTLLLSTVPNTSTEPKFHNLGDAKVHV